MMIITLHTPRKQCLRCKKYRYATFFYTDPKDKTRERNICSVCIAGRKKPADVYASGSRRHVVLWSAIVLPDGVKASACHAGYLWKVHPHLYKTLTYHDQETRDHPDRPSARAYLESFIKTEVPSKKAPRRPQDDK